MTVCQLPPGNWLFLCLSLRPDSKIRQAGAGNIGDLTPTTCGNSVSGGQPGTAYRFYVLQRQVIRGCLAVNSAGRAKGHIRERAAERLDGRYTTRHLRREKLEFPVAKSVAHHQFRYGGNAGQQWGLRGHTKLQNGLSHARRDDKLGTGGFHLAILRDTGHGTRAYPGLGNGFANLLDGAHAMLGAQGDLQNANAAVYQSAA